MEASQFEDFLGRARWFGGKGRPWRVTAARSIALLRPEPPRLEIWVITVTYDDGGETETYQVPLAFRDWAEHQLEHVFVAYTGEHVYDAVHDRWAASSWLTTLAGAAPAGTEVDELVFHPQPGIAEVALDASPRAVIAEQSNSSVIYGDQAILKVFRKLTPGLNPDIEIHAALTSAGSTRIAPLLGWVTGRWYDEGAGEEREGSFAMLQTFLRSASEGWDLAKTSVRDLFAERDLHPEEVGGDFADEAQRLGQATAQVHADLARTLETGILDAAGVAALAAGMRERLERAVAAVPELAPYADALRSAYDDLAELEEPVPVQRVHGDYHLGQVMRTTDGWKLLDFEGEPARAAEERRNLESPLRDVAGMLRSFDYAARQLLADHNWEKQREYRAQEWATRNRDAFCEGYAEMAGRDPRDDRVLLRAFETDKAVYEVVYEARNRPGWLRIPLAAIERLAAAQ